MTLPDLARRCDAFYLGGTKQGLLFGEALVLAHPALQRDFRYHLKQHGGCWPRAGCWDSSSRPCWRTALLRPGPPRQRAGFRLRDGVAALGYPFPVASPSNQQFPVLPNETVAKLQEMGYELRPTTRWMPAIPASAW